MQTRLSTDPACTTADWYATRDRAPHLEQAAHIARLRRAVDFILHAIDQGGTNVVDLGAGDGGLLSLLESVPCWGYDLQPSNIDGAHERGVDVTLANVLTDPIVWADIAVATEMLEHLVDPHAFVRTIAQHSRYLIASSPAFETAESHYPFHLWCWDMDGYRALIEQAGYTIIHHELAGDFQVLLVEQ